MALLLCCCSRYDLVVWRTESTKRRGRWAPPPCCLVEIRSNKGNLACCTLESHHGTNSPRVVRWSLHTVASGGPAAPWSPRAGRSLPRRFPLPAPFWARLPVSRAQKKILPAQQAQKKKPPRVPVVSGRGAGAGAGLRPMYAAKKRAPQWLSYLPTPQKNERLWASSPVSGKKNASQ